MTALLTLNEYKSIAASLELPESVFIAGKSMSPRGESFEAINPANGRPLASLPVCHEDVVNEAVGKARESFDSGVWSRMDPSERKKVLIRLVRLMRLEFLQSGFGRRDNGVHAFDQYTQLKTLWIDTADRELESGIT